jgi:hypothetical protein
MYSLTDAAAGMACPVWVTAIRWLTGVFNGEHAEACIINSNVVAWRLLNFGMGHSPLEGCGDFLRTSR